MAKALNDLSLGESYADVSLALRAHRDAASTHLAEAHGVEAFTHVSEPVALDTGSFSRRQRRNAWRVAADLVEQYSPLLFGPVHDQFVADAQAVRDTNDRLLAADPNAHLREPLVYVMDELPIWTKAGPGGGKRPSWNVLAVVEVRWHPTTDPAGLPERDTRLRLVRAFPRGNTDAWQLVLHELGPRPDFVVADYGQGLATALRTYYGDEVGVVPSLWHVHKNLRDALVELDNTTYLDGREKILVDPLRKHLSTLARIDLVGATERDITEWWDQLVALVASLPAPVSSITALRDIHEPRLVAALPVLTVNPHVPASNAAVENKIRGDLKPFLKNRAHLFGNAERTNRLLNLLVCRQAGVFTNLDDLALRIRQANEATGGWAPAPRQIVDVQPTGDTHRARFSSLKSRSTITKLAKNKNIPTTVEVHAASTPAVLSKQRPETVARAGVREWARSLGLPAGVTGPIRSSVHAAYAAAVAGASDDQARAIYEKSEAERIAANDKAKKARWRGKAEKERARELAPVREWAKTNNITLPRNGIIPKTVMDAYKAANPGGTP